MIFQTIPLFRINALFDMFFIPTFFTCNPENQAPKIYTYDATL